MSITIELSEETERAVAERAAECGQSPQTYVSDVVRNHVSKPKTFAEILAPFRKEVEESGITDEEFTALIEQARNEAWAERYGKKP